MAKKFIVRRDIPKEPAMIIEGQLIISPGEYYGIPLSEDKIKDHIRLTDWTDKFNTALVYGHKTNTSTEWIGNPSPDDWAGHFSAPKYLSLSDGVSVEGAYSNIYIYDDNLARKLAYGKLKCGVSVTLDLATGGFKNLSVVDNPKCKQAFLNLSDGGKELENVEILSPKYLNMSDNDKYVSSGKDSALKTTIEDNHWHITELDKDGNGVTTQTIPIEGGEDSPHIHKISNNSILDIGGHVHEVVKLLNLSDSPTIERGKNSKDIMTEKNEKTELELELEKKVSALEEQIVEKNKKLEEVKTPIEVKPKEEDKKEEIPKVEDKKPEEKPKEDPVIITEEKPKDDTAVVSAIEKMADKVTEQLKQVAEPATVAPTSQDQSNNSRDDKVTQSLVEKYESLHGLNE